MTENNNLNIFSFRHQLHYITAIEIFKENKLKGAGIKSFRYLCDEDNFSQKISQLIEERSKVYAEFDGTIYEKVIDENDKLKKDYDKYYIIDGNIVSKDIQRQYINNGILRI